MIVKLQNEDNNNAQLNNLHVNNKEKENETTKNSKSKSINASDLNLQQDNILMKKLQANKKALKTVLDVFKAEQVADDSIKEHMQKSREYTEEANQSLQEINRIVDLKKGLKEDYGILDDSQEQKDLKILEKQQSKKDLTEAERQRLKEMSPVTEYQSAALEYEKIVDEWNYRLNNAKRYATGENKIVNAIKVEQVKTHSMVDAQKAADDIQQAASDDVVGLLLGEAKDKVDADREENEETAEEVKAEEEAKEKLIEKNRKQDEDNNISYDLLNQVTRADNAQDKLQQEIKNMIDSQKLLEDDIKGIEIDEQL